MWFKEEKWERKTKRATSGSRQRCNKCDMSDSGFSLFFSFSLSTRGQQLHLNISQIHKTKRILSGIDLYLPQQGRVKSKNTWGQGQVSGSSSNVILKKDFSLVHCPPCPLPIYVFCFVVSLHDVDCLSLSPSTWQSHFLFHFIYFSVCLSLSYWICLHAQNHLLAILRLFRFTFTCEPFIELF